MVFKTSVYALLTENCNSVFSLNGVINKASKLIKSRPNPNLVSLVSDFLLFISIILETPSPYLGLVPFFRRLTSFIK